MRTPIKQPIPLHQRMRDVAGRLEQTNLQTLSRDVAEARELLRFAADQIQTDQSPLRTAEAAFDRAREKLDAFLAGAHLDGPGFCESCGEELDS